MITVPTDKRDCLDLANQLIEQCRVSVGMRSAYYRLMNAIAETGRYDGTKSLINMLYTHLARTASHMYSPTELKFSVDFDRTRRKVDIDRGKEVAKVLTNKWALNGTATRFGRGVFEGLKYGAAILKQWPESDGEGDNKPPRYRDKIVMPWQFGVYREDENNLDDQEAICETISLTLPEVWQRIYRFPDADKLFDKIKTHARSSEAGQDPASYFHQVLSTSQLNTGVQGMTRPVPGGIVQLNNDPNYSIMGPVVAAEVVQMHELWVKDERDYTTIQVIEPDILISPRYKKANLLGVERTQPYRLIQPNEVTNWFWGRSELVDLIEPQALLSTWADDVKRLFGLQIDKILGFSGEAGITEEIYGQFRNAGWLNIPQGGDIKDVTPKFPPEAIPMLKFVIEIINLISGFPEIMQGKGEPGVRAGVHASTLLKTGSPYLRDRALLVERQCAACADLTLSMMEAKDPENYWLTAENPITDVEQTKFLLSELPDDWHVVVDSHSSSPIFSEDNVQLIMQGNKMGIVTGEYVLDQLPFPNRAQAKQQLKEKAKADAESLEKLTQSNPELAGKLAEKKVLGRK